MGPPGGALRECQPGSPRVPYRRMSNSVHHAQACVGSTRGQRDPLQLAEHSGAYMLSLRNANAGDFSV